MKIDKFHNHEVLHVASIVSDIIDSHLLEHPAIQNNDLWKQLTEDALDAVSKLYQQIGEDIL